MALPSIEPGASSTPGRAARGRSALVGAALVAASAVAFSGKAILAKLMYREGADAIATLALRMVFAAPVYLAVAFAAARRPEARPLTRREVAAIGVLGVLGYYGSSVLDFVGLAYVSAGLERLILFTYPTIVVVLSAIVLGERIHRHQLAALAITYAGLVLVVRSELTHRDDGSNVWLGSALVFLGALLYAGYLVFSTRFIRRLGPERFTALALLVSTGAVLLHALVSGATLTNHTPRVYCLGLVMGLACTVFPTFALAEGIRRLGPGPSAILGTIGPASTLLLAHILLDEPIGALQIAGTALVLGGAAWLALHSR